MFMAIRNWHTGQLVIFWISISLVGVAVVLISAAIADDSYCPTEREAVRQACVLGRLREYGLRQMPDSCVLERAAPERSPYLLPRPGDPPPGLPTKLVDDPNCQWTTVVLELGLKLSADDVLQCDREADRAARSETCWQTMVPRSIAVLTPIILLITALVVSWVWFGHRGSGVS